MPIDRHLGAGLSALASLLPAAERSRVRDSAACLERMAREQSWHGAEPAALRQRVCFVVAAIAPALPPDRLSVLARYALWSFRFDDAIDASGAAPAALARVRDTVARVAAGGAADAGDPMQAGLARTLDDLARLDSGGALVHRFRVALRDAAAAEVEQVLLGRAVAAGSAPPPTAERYLAVAGRTANYHSFAFLLLAVVAGSLPAELLARLDPALEQAGRAVRLANDLRSVARDRSTSGLNIVDLCTAAGEPMTERRVVADIDRHLWAHHLALVVSDPAGPAAQALRRSLRVTVGTFRVSAVR